MTFNLLITARSFGFASNRAMEALHAIPGLVVEKPKHTAAFNEEQMCELVPGRDAVIVGTDRVSAKVIAAADRLKVIAKHGVGVDNIDVAAATEVGIIVTNLPGMNDLAVADMAFGLLIALSRGIGLVNNRIKNRDWSKVLSHDVSGKTLGIIGTGRIGQAMIRRALAFDMTVIAYDVEPNNEAAEALGFVYVPFEELIASADFISLHVPLRPGTEGLIGAAELARMKPTAYLINTSRGGVVDEEALLKALKEGTIAGAALDVYSSSFPERKEVYELENLIVTPHIAAYTYETLESMDMALVEAFRQIVRSEMPTNVTILNPEVRGFRVTQP